MKKAQNVRAMTLVELLCIIAIIFVLTALIKPVIYRDLKVEKQELRTQTIERMIREDLSFERREAEKRDRFWIYNGPIKWGPTNSEEEEFLIFWQNTALPPPTETWPGTIPREEFWNIHWVPPPAMSPEEDRRYMERFPTRPR